VSGHATGQRERAINALNAEIGESPRARESALRILSRPNGRSGGGVAAIGRQVARTPRSDRHRSLACRIKPVLGVWPSSSS